MTVQEAEKHIRELCVKHNRINVTARFVQALETIFKAVYSTTYDEIGFRSFCRLWLSQIIHYKTVPGDSIVQKELARSLLMPTQQMLFRLSETIGDIGVDRFFEERKIITLDDLKCQSEIRNIYSPLELERNLRPMYSQLKVLANV